MLLDETRGQLDAHLGGDGASMFAAQPKCFQKALPRGGCMNTQLALIITNHR